MNTSDRELLELAAKAVGLNIKGYRVDIDDSFTHLVIGKKNTRERVNWNPLTDDGDALRLAVKLRLSIDHNHIADQQRWVAADRNGCEGVCSPVSAVEDEFEESGRAAATRRAITMAAAEIGKVMP